MKNPGINPDVIYEDNHIIVVNKPAGILSQGDISGDVSMLDILKSYVKEKYNKPGEAFMGLVHRLDRQVSGLMVFARTSKAASRLHSEITSGRMEKYYLALTCKGLPVSDTWHRLDNHLVREKDKTFIVPGESRDSQKAVLHYSVLKSGTGNSLILIKLETGRKHQIRAQMANIGAPIHGDSKYGSLADTGKGICLHSVYLSFLHPVQKSVMEFFSGPPEIFYSTGSFIPEDLQARVTEKIRLKRLRP